MLTFIGIIVLSFLSGLIVYALHRYQSLEVEYRVDRTMPLPPLKEGLNTGNLSSLDRLSAGTTNLHPPQTTEASQIHNTPATDQKNDQTDVTESYSGSWQAQVVQAKQAGDFAFAAQLCETRFPLWSAYNQYCILLRAELKTAEARADETGLIAAKLLKLYRIAAIAELLHDKSAGEIRYTLNQLRNMPLQQLDELDMPYSEIGYAQLRLIRKADEKLMLDHWGRPAQHRSPRQYHRSWWRQFSRIQD